MDKAYLTLANRKVGLNLNEHPKQPNEIVDINIDLKSLELNRYLSQEEGPLLKALTDYTHLDKDKIVIGNGADELIANIIDYYVKDKLLIISPTFGVYESYARQRGKEVLKVELDENFNIPHKRVFEILRNEKIDLIIICNPNNPTGNLFDLNIIENIVKLTNAKVLVDEAYYEFSEVSIVEKISVYNNLIILRTLSKAFAAAGMRIGYAISSSKRIKEIRSMQMPFNINNFSQYYAAMVLESKEIFLDELKSIKTTRDKLAQELLELGFKVFASKTNFLLVRPPINASKLLNNLQKEGIHIRSYEDEPRLKDKLRISIGGNLENENLIKLIKKIVGEIDDN